MTLSFKNSHIPSMKNKMKKISPGPTLFQPKKIAKGMGFWLLILKRTLYFQKQKEEYLEVGSFLINF